MLFEIRSRFDGRVLFSLECGSLKLCVEAAVTSKADLRGADLGGAYLRGADLRGANLRGAYLGGANLGGANLGGADLGEPGKTRIEWTSHALLSEILWRAAHGNREREMVAAWVGRKTDLCWRDFAKLEHPEKEWALDELRKWVTPDDGAPDILKIEVVTA